jgi:hypothetical protein
VAASYGGCAIYGCESKKAREVSAVGYFARAMTIFLSAAIFPPRVLRSLLEEPDLGSVLPRAFQRARALWVSPSATLGKKRALIYAILVLPVSYWLGLTTWLPIRSAWWHVPAEAPNWTLLSPNLSREGLHVPVSLAAVTVFLLLWFAWILLLPFVAAFGIAACLNTGRLLGQILKSEFAALARADEGRSGSARNFQSSGPFPTRQPSVRRGAVASCCRFG